MMFLFHWVMFRFHVNFQRCNYECLAWMARMAHMNQIAQEGPTSKYVAWYWKGTHFSVVDRRHGLTKKTLTHPEVSFHLGHSSRYDYLAEINKVAMAYFVQEWQWQSNHELQTALAATGVACFSATLLVHSPTNKNHWATGSSEPWMDCIPGSTCWVIGVDGCGISPPPLKKNGNWKSPVMKRKIRFYLLA